ncbi:MAG: type II 3-dehydroquinate dehydratase [Coriobacteriia bacterium]|nr:type II 3-dehydroquinate dehydratase [Coriobacteriia bacterium]
MRFLILNGPNLNMLGTREPEIYGSQTLGELMDMVHDYAAERGVKTKAFQSNSEEKLIEQIHLAPIKYQGIVYNPAAHSHYSYALRDAVAGTDVPVVEVHLSDITAREKFRRESVIAPVCIAQYSGEGVRSYLRGIDALIEENARHDVDPDEPDLLARGDDEYDGLREGDQR